MPDVDWVTARAACSLGEIFEKLKAQVKQDIETRNALLDSLPREHRYYGFRFLSNGRTFTTLLEGNKIHRSVVFALDGLSINVSDDSDDSASFSATPTLNSDGRCLLKVGDKEYELWQFRQKALESLLFSKPKPSDPF